MTDWTVEIYKQDRRRKDGYRPAGVLEYKDMSEEAMIATLQHIREDYPEPNYKTELHETWVTRKNLLSGKEYREHYTTPYHCSPASESYWAN